MLRTRILALGLFSLALTAVTANAQIRSGKVANDHAHVRLLRITEVDPATNEVEIRNFGTTFTTTEDHPLCYRDGVAQIPTGTVFAAGETKVFVVEPLDDQDTDLWLFTEGAPARRRNVAHGLKYGPTPNVGHTGMAAAQGRWPDTSSFVPTPVAGATLAWDGHGLEPADWYVDETPSMGEEDPTVIGSHASTISYSRGAQDFEALPLGDEIVTVADWGYVDSSERGRFTVRVVNDALGLVAPRPNSTSTRWLRVRDQEAGDVDSRFSTPVVEAEAPRAYSWSFFLNLESTPPGALDAKPRFVVQHFDGGFVDTWGVELSDEGASLFVTDAGGTASSVELYELTSPTGVGEWVEVTIAVDFNQSEVSASANGGTPVSLPVNPDATLDRKVHRLSYDGGGYGNTGTVLIDDVGLRSGAADCKECFTVDFETEDDFLTALADGQDVSSPPEFGNLIEINGSGANNVGAAIFDTDPGGPNAAGPDPDLLIDCGNALILQDTVSSFQSLAGFYDEPNDARFGGTITIDFLQLSEPLSVKLADIDVIGGIDQGVSVTLTDDGGLSRVYNVPAGWTEDIDVDGPPGFRVLDLNTGVVQPGFASAATAFTQPGYEGKRVVQMTVEFGGSAALDDLSFCVPCVTLDFETEDDGTTAIVNGQDISSPPEFGNLVDINALPGPHLGAAIFDTTIGGPNDPGFDNDLLVDLGNALILQNDTTPTQNGMAGVFDIPDDDQDGGTIEFDFAPYGNVEAKSIDVIDICKLANQAAMIVLTDGSGKTRTYDVPPGYTEEITTDGPPGFRLVDLTTLAIQTGFCADATAVEDAGYDGTDVAKIEVTFNSSGAIDNLCFCP